jgi:NosR/NirI family transcriptional regulator, nitrous oxide reductase regulator
MFRWYAKYFFACVWASLILVLVHQPPALAADDLEFFLSETPANTIFAEADSYGQRRSDAPIVPVLAGGETVGYVFLNTDFTGAVGYSGKPIYILIGLRKNGEIAGAKLVKHSEPIVLAGIPEEKIENFIAGYAGTDILTMAREKAGEPPPVDIVSGATVTIMVMDDSIKRASIRAARILGLGGLEEHAADTGPARTIDTSSDDVLDWTDLVANGSVRRLRLSVSDINQAFVDQGNEKAIARPEGGEDGETFIDLFAASLAVPAIARSLLGDQEYKNYLDRLGDGQNGFLIMASGRYSFRGSGYVRGGIFDRIQVTQGEESLRFRDRGYKNLGDVAATGAPDFREVALFITPQDAVFDPANPWQLQLLVQRAVGALEKVFVAFELSYRLPDIYVNVEEPAEARPASNEQSSGRQSLGVPQSNALWLRIWNQKPYQIAILLAAIGILTIIFFAQDQLAKHPKLGDWIRIGFLTFTLFWLGFYAQAQLSVVNVFAFVNALLSDFRWEYFLLEPLIFILWSSTAASLILWGRGPFCGWLCPFGALQELTNKIAKFFGVPQIEVPWWVHERLRALKYLIFLALIGISIYSLTLAEQLAEIEPFKTSIILHFVRAWPYLLFVGALLFAGLFIERFYCRYLCPLGAALSIPGQLHLFDWLKRYSNCGDPCQICAQKCMVQAIEPSGRINANECMDCFHCQQLYYDKDVCPVMIHKFAKANKGKAPSGAGKASSTGNPLYRRPRRLGRARDIES